MTEKINTAIRGLEVYASILKSPVLANQDAKSRKAMLETMTHLDQMVRTWAVTNLKSQTPNKVSQNGK